MKRFTFRTATTIFFALVALPFAPSAEAQPFADGPEKELAPKPKSRSWTDNEGGFGVTFDMTPAIPDPGKSTEIMILAAKIPKVPDPKYGNRVPLKPGAVLYVEITNPAKEVIGRFVAHKLPLMQGRYGFHFTPKTKGVYQLKLTGKTADGKDVTAAAALPVQVWPLPPELEGTGENAGGQAIRRVIRKPIK